MVNLTMVERQDMIRQLAGKDIGVMLNLKFNSGISIGNKGDLMIHGNTVINTETESPSVKVTDEDPDFSIPTDTDKYDIIKTEHGTYWKLKN